MYQGLGPAWSSDQTVAVVVVQLPRMSLGSAVLTAGYSSSPRTSMGPVVLTVVVVLGPVWGLFDPYGIAWRQHLGYLEPWTLSGSVAAALVNDPTQNTALICVHTGRGHCGM